MRRKNVVDRPGLTAVFGDEPARFAGKPRKRQRKKRELEERALFRDDVLDRVDGAQNEDERHGEAAAHHQAEGPEHRRDARNRVGGGLSDHFRRGRGNVFRVALQKETVAEVVLHGGEGFAQFGVLGILAQGLERRHGLDAVFNAFAGLGFQLVDAGDFRRERTRADETHHPGEVDLRVVRAGLFVGKGEERHRGGRFVRVPDGFHGGDLGRLIARHEVARFITHVNGEERRDRAEDGGEAEARLGKGDVLTAQHVVGGERHDEHRACHVAAGDRVGELGLRPFARDDGPEVRHFHSHGFEIEFRTHGRHHPGVGDENPKGREIRAERHEAGGQKVLALGETVPAEEEEADEGRLQEEGHEPFNGERGAENVADVVGVVRPVRPELELHGDARGDAEGEVDAEELAPETGHVLVHFLARHDVGHFHNDEHEGEPQREGHKEEVVHRRQRELQA